MFWTVERLQVFVGHAVKRNLAAWNARIDAFPLQDDRWFQKKRRPIAKTDACACGASARMPPSMRCWPQTQEGPSVGGRPYGRSRTTPEQRKAPQINLGRRLLKLRALLALPGALPSAGEFYVS